MDCLVEGAAAVAFHKRPEGTLGLMVLCGMRATPPTFIVLFLFYFVEVHIFKSRAHKSRSGLKIYRLFKLLLKIGGY